MKAEQKIPFESIYNEYHAMVRQLCLGYLKGNTTIANDLCQEVFINIWNSIDQFKRQSTVKTWVYRITVNTCLQYLRKEKSRQKRAFNHPEEETGYGKSDYPELYNAIGQLKKVDRLITMMLLEELSYEEIGDILGISPTNLRVKIHRIKKKLKKLVRDEQRTY